MTCILETIVVQCSLQSELFTSSEFYVYCDERVSYRPERRKKCGVIIVLETAVWFQDFCFFVQAQTWEDGR